MSDTEPPKPSLVNIPPPSDLTSNTQDVFTPREQVKLSLKEQAHYAHLQLTTVLEKWLDEAKDEVQKRDAELDRLRGVERKYHGLAVGRRWEMYFSAGSFIFCGIGAALISTPEGSTWPHSVPGGWSVLGLGLVLSLGTVIIPHTYRE